MLSIILLSDRGDPALTEMPVCRDFAPSLSPRSPPKAGALAFAAQDAGNLVALVMWIMWLVRKCVATYTGTEGSSRKRPWSRSPTLFVAPAAHTAPQTRSGLFAVSGVLPCFLFIHSEIFIEHLPSVKSDQGAEEKTRNKIHNVPVLVELTLWVGRDKDKDTSTDDVSRVWGEGTRAVKADRPGQGDGDCGGGRDAFPDTGAEN